MADDFGAHLKHERELRGISLDEIASTTKIHVKYLKALEENHFDDLPGEVFIKGFIRSYGKAIGANVDELLIHYDASVGEERKTVGLNQIPASEEEKDRQTHITNTLVGGFLGLFLVFAIWYLVQSPPKPSPQEMQGRPPAKAPLVSADSEKGGDSSQPVEDEPGDKSGLEEPEAPEDTEAPEPESSAEPLDSPAEEAAAPPEQEKPVTENQNGGIIQPLQDQQVQPDAENSPQAVAVAPLELQIRVTENAWFNVTLDGTGEKDFILPAGTSKRFKADKEMRLTIGNRRATRLQLNGKSLELPPAVDNVVRDFKVNLKTIE